MATPAEATHRPAKSDGTHERRRPHLQSAEELARELGVDPQQGLTNGQVEERRQAHGPNELQETPPPPLWKRIVRQFASVLIGILIVAAIISGILGEWPETIAIAAIILLNALIGFLQEEKAERALAALRELAAPGCRVLRDGHEAVLPAAELVPGDIIHFETGDQVPADARLFESIRLSAQEAALTGESTPVHKQAGAVLQPGAALADRRNMVYSGTSIAAGKGSAIVVSTGMHTELGRIAGMLERTEQEPTPLQRRLTALGKHLSIVCGAIVLIIFVINIARGREVLEVLLYSVSLAVAAVPEGLPAVVTIALALGVQRMARRNALIRHLPSVETLGCVTCICSDKTGTLTRNEMTVQQIWTPGDQYRVSGIGYAPDGEFTRVENGDATAKTETVPGEPRAAGGAIENGEPVSPRDEPELAQALRIGAVCNNAGVEQQNGEWRVLGDPTEAALRVAALKAGIETGAFERQHEIPFESDRKAMSVVARDESGAAAMFAKGAPEVLLERCTRMQLGDDVAPITDDIRERVRRAADDMGEKALRVLALAWKPLDGGDPDEAEEQDLVLTGLAGMIDPPRTEVADAIAVCRSAGIRPVMITGDQPHTAMAVARELHMAADGDEAITGRRLDDTSEDELRDRVEKAAVYARVSPEHKLRIVRALRKLGHVAAMTGDGVNDAPALKAADVGVAMGITGTDVTRGAADMVLMDDNFATIVAAVEEGRGIFDNIQKVTHFLLSCNAGELLFLFFAALVGWPAPLVAVQILWINLITDGVPALALGVEPAERDIMQRSPREPRAPVISRHDALVILGHGLLIAAVAAGGFAWVLLAQDRPLAEARAVAFSTMAFSQLFFAIACRSRRYTMPEIGWFSNRPLFIALAVSIVLQVGLVSIPAVRELLDIAALTAWEWAIVGIMSLIPVTVIEGAKLVRAKRAGRAGAK